MSTLHSKLKLPLKRVELQIDHQGMGYIHNADDDEISAYGSFNLTEEENREFGELIVTAVNAHTILTEALEELLRIDNAREESGLIIHRMPAHIRKKAEAALKLARSET